MQWQIIYIDVLAHYGGDVSDNTNDALLKDNLTIQKIGMKVDKLNYDLPLTDTVFGITRQIIGFGDPFHIDNLVMTHASKSAFGETEQDNHSQIYHQ